MNDVLHELLALTRPPEPQRPRALTMLAGVQLMEPRLGSESHRRRTSNFESLPGGTVRALTERRARADALSQLRSATTFATARLDDRRNHRTARQLPIERLADSLQRTALDADAQRRAQQQADDIRRIAEEGVVVKNPPAGSVFA